MVSTVKKGKINVCKMTLGSMATNTYIVYDENKKGFIVDPAADGDMIKIKVTELGVSIEGIFLTHGHFDHIGAVKALRKIYGRVENDNENDSDKISAADESLREVQGDIKIYAHELEREVLENSEKNLSALFGDAFTERADVYVKDGDDIEIGQMHIKVIHTPGHTVGGASYLVSNGDGKVLFSGDTLFAGTFGRYDFPTGNYRELIKSIRDKLMLLEDELYVCPGHNEDTTVGNEKILYMKK